MGRPATDDFATLTAGASVVAAVTEDASLDQFASSGKTDESETDDSADSDTSDAADPEESATQFEDADEPEVEPAVSTFTWSSEGGECADCGASIGRRWRSEGQKDGNLVCADCKEW